MPENCIYIARSSAIAARALAGEMMVMNSADSTFFTLNEVATAIFQAADGHTPLRQIVRERICEQFDVDPDQAQADAEQFVTSRRWRSVSRTNSLGDGLPATGRSFLRARAGRASVPQPRCSKTVKLDGPAIAGARSRPRLWRAGGNT